MNQSVPIPQRIDPLRATEAAAIGTAFEMIVVFSRATFAPDANGPNAISSPSAAVAMTWEVAKKVRDLLSDQIKKREEQLGPIRDLDAEMQTQTVQ